MLNISPKSLHDKNQESVRPEEARPLRRLEGFNQNSFVFLHEVTMFSNPYDGAA